MIICESTLKENILLFDQPDFELQNNHHNYDSFKISFNYVINYLYENYKILFSENAINMNHKDYSMSLNTKISFFFNKFL